MKPLPLLLSTALLLTGALANAAPLPEKIDISGVALGSSAENAEQTIRQQLPKSALRYLEVKTGPRKEKVGAYSRTSTELRSPADIGPSDMGPTDEFVALFNRDGRVWFVSRLVRMPEGERIAYDELLAAIGRKFGEPTMSDRNRVTLMRWELMTNGQEPKRLRPTDSSECERSTTTLKASFARQGSNVLQMDDGPINAPTRFSEYCRRMVEFVAVRDPDGMVPYYRIQIVDVELRYNDIELEKAEERRRKEILVEQERAKAPAPKF